MAVSQFYIRAGNVFIFVGKHKAHPGAVWEGSQERVWFCVGCSSGLTRVSEFCAYSLLWETTKRTRVRYGRVQGKGSGSSWHAHQTSGVMCKKMQSAPGCGMGGFQGKGLLGRGMHIKPHGG